MSWTRTTPTLLASLTLAGSLLVAPSAHAASPPSAATAGTQLSTTTLVGAAPTATPPAAAAKVTAAPAWITDAIPCQDVVFIGARGSGEKAVPATLRMGTRSYLAYKEYLAALASKTRTFRVGYWAPSIYPALPVPISFRPSTVQNFLNGIDTGVAEVLTFITRRAYRCPTEHYVLAGYSQGAMVVHRLLWELIKPPGAGEVSLLPQLDGIIAIADGDRYPNQGALNYGTSAGGNGAEGVALLAVARLAAIGARYFAQSRTLPTAQLGTHRFHSVCDKGDAVCDTSYVARHGSLLVLTNGAYIHTHHYLKAHDTVAKAAAAVAAFTDKRTTLPTPMSITTAASSDAALTLPFLLLLATRGAGHGTGSVVWTTRGGTLPPGVSLHAGVNLLQGTPTKVGTYTFTVRATDPNGQWIDKALTIHVAPTLIVTVRPWSDGSLAGAALYTPTDGGTDCTGTSLTTRADAYRCYAGSLIHDPCFANPADTSSYLCPPPFGGSWTLLRNATRAVRFPGTGAPGTTEIFSVALANGAFCNTATGAGPEGIPGYPWWVGVCFGGPFPEDGAIWRVKTRGSGPTFPLYPTGVAGQWGAAVETSPGKATLLPVTVARR